MTLTVFGIPNCDTVRKARRFLDEHGVDYDFHDVREQPLPLETLQEWVKQLGRDTLINKRSTSWRELSDEEKQLLDDVIAVQLLQRFPTLMKRPVLAHQQRLLVGFKSAEWQQALEL
ncbi:arsenate reductase [Pseudidiomarina terrestris]|uniref:Arsenate reductase n=1 Tax=Pseudidiomarina terrestris TaxID=2820060 RepID=A0AAW7QXB9_9GAMM|nr:MULTISPECIES: arsenate reductase [unclassified Pseudidiomarina]MDN7124107.1 arsenate reductase [Pseudidiomarina sp. 1APP75-32.1]MDN7127179.1 arsenate reductase [Pseudidiomarina sp. 1APR75-33.1]MDN7128364.1 arsenate reductase [Pseudidiomarina sp. 1APR75-15]MDN7135408.1 arsenate reductase [Pseudidiomarina sp. 1ASP75-5]MDN7138560.1 arsenate reductase [Pseudidiomarina sp. 1ASP75-14]